MVMSLGMASPELQGTTQELEVPAETSNHLKTRGILTMR